jgi:hypothetical protein
LRNFTTPHGSFMFNRNRLDPAAALSAAALGMGLRAMAISLNRTAPAGAPG